MLELNNLHTKNSNSQDSNDTSQGTANSRRSLSSSLSGGGSGDRSITATTIMFNRSCSNANDQGQGSTTPTSDSNTSSSSILSAAQESLLPQQQQQQQLRRRENLIEASASGDQVALLSDMETTSTPCNSPSSPSYYYNNDHNNNTSSSNSKSFTSSKSVSFSNDTTFVNGNSSSSSQRSSSSLPSNSHTLLKVNNPGTSTDNNNNNSDNNIQGSFRNFWDRRRETLLALRGTSSVRLQRRIKMFECMKRLGYCLAVLTFIILLVAIPLLTIHAINEYNIGLDIGAFYSAGAFVILTIPISMYEIFLHLTHWYMPDVQKYVVRILWMVPLYSIQSWLSLRYHEFSLFIDTFRDMYEAFVIQSFLYYLIELLGGEDVLAGTLRLKGASEDNYQRNHGEHGWCLETFFCMKRWDMGEDFMLQCKHGVLQYVVIKVLATVFTFVLKVCGEYGEGTSDLTKGYIYISFVTNFSQMYALYVLIKLFYATKYELTHPVDWHPVGKFICVKGVVFFTWWQGAGIAMLQEYGFIIELGHWTADDVATGVQDYLVCLEMVFFAIAHTYTFTYTEYMNEAFNDPLLMSSHSIPPSHHHEMNILGGGNNNVDDYDPMMPSNGNNKKPSSSSNNKATTSGTYRAPPVVRKLAQPQHFSTALWSSSIPSETWTDIYRLPQGRRKLISGPTTTIATTSDNATTTTTTTQPGPIQQAVTGNIGDNDNTTMNQIV